MKQPRQGRQGRKFMQAEPGYDIVHAMDHVFRAWFDGESWDAWRVTLKPRLRCR
jgi:hypothetical protein